MVVDLGIVTSTTLEAAPVSSVAWISGPPEASDAPQAASSVPARATITKRARTPTVHREGCRRASHHSLTCHDPAVNSPVTPGSIAPPAARYSHAVMSVGAQRLLHTSGVVPVAPDGTVPTGLVDQAQVVWANLQAILEAAEMTVGDVVSITTYAVQGEDLGTVMTARDEAMAGHRPASTLVVVPALARPEWRLEISLVAAR